MTLIQNLLAHTSNENIFYIEELADIIIDEKIISLEELKQYEEVYNRHMTLEDSLKYWIKIIDEDPFEFDEPSYDQIQKLKQERRAMDVGSIDERLTHVIKYYMMTNRDNPFPYRTYEFIIEGKI